MIKKLAVLIGIIWMLIFTIWLALSAVLVIKRDEIGQYLVFYLNHIQSGELTIGQVSISPIRQFPRFSLNLQNITYYEHRANQRSDTEQPIARIKNFYCGLEILKLLKGDIEISKVNVSNGEILIIIYPDSSVNLLNAIKSDTTIASKKTPGLSKVEPKRNEPYISIENLSIRDIHLKVTNDPDKRESSVLINNFESDFDFKESKANLNFTSSILIEKFKINENNYITNQEINLDALSHLDKNNGLKIEEGKLVLANSTFHFSGNFNPSNEGDLSLKIVSDGSLNILSLFVKENVAKNLNKGDFYFFGFVEGKTFSEFPLINVDFGFKNVELVNPLTNRKIKNLNLKGFFNSGRNKNLSEATLKIDTLFADFPNGHIELAGSLHNFVKPEYDVNLLLNADVTGLNDIFNLTKIDSLKGKIKIEDRTKGTYDISKKRFLNEINVSNIDFENFGFIIPGTIRFDKIDGTISRNGDAYVLKDLNIKSEATDFNINGEVENIQYLIFDIEKEIKANLAIKSNVFDPPNFLAFDPSIKRDFPHRILNLDLLVDATSTTSKLLHFKSFPDISFDIKKLNATAEDFLPVINIESGIFKVSKNVLGFHLDFDDFKTNFLDGKFNFTGDYNSSRYQPYYIKTNIDMDDIDISKLLFSETDDSIPDFYKGKLDGSLSMELQFANDTTEINLFNIQNGDINYFYGENSIIIKSLFFTSEKIDYSIDKNPNPLATLFAKGNIKADEIKTSEFLVNQSDFDFLIQNGEYNVETRKPKFFGDNSKGEIKYLLKPFIENPSYHIYCNISSFDIKEMMYTFLKDTTISGNLSLYMDMSMMGKEWKDMLATMNGEINLSGKNLIFYGIDADKMIEEFQRSQNFNLVDAGAVLLAGPIGLAVTKGTDFAKILIINPGQSSQITQLVSNWNSKDGLLTLKDVALSTKKNRVAAKGWLNSVNDSLSISFAVIDPKGCSIFTQDVYGDLNKPTLGKVKVVSTLLAPVTNLYDNIMNVNCNVFYNGTLPSPK